MNKKLNIRQERFCQKYLECGIAVEAMLLAYPSRANWKRDTQDQAASRLLNNSKIMARVKDLQEEELNRSVITKDQILQELSGIAFSTIADMHSSWIERKEFDRLSKQEKSAIRSISTKIVKKNIGTSDMPEIVDVEYVKIELYDKIKAIERICKMLGFDSPAELNIKTDEDMSREDILKELDRLRGLREKN